MSALEELITIIDEAADPAKLIAALTEAVQRSNAHSREGKTARFIIPIRTFLF